MKKYRKKQDAEKLPQGSRLWTVSIAAAFLAAAAVFAVMLKLEQNMLSSYEKGRIFIAAREIPKGQKLTAENYDTYFRETELDKNCIPPTAIQDTGQLGETIPVFDIDQGVLLTSGMFENLEEVKSNMRLPVIAGVKAEDLHQVAGGILRAGDRIHIYTVREDGETVPVWREAFVEQVFDASGNTISCSDRTTAAQRINIYLEEGEVEKFFSELAAGSLRVVKVCD